MNNTDINKLGLSLDICLTDNGEMKIKFFVVAKHAPRFKAVNACCLNHNEILACIAKYSESNRLIKVIGKGDCAREACISPQAPFVEQLKKCNDLTIDGVQVAKVNVMSVEEYEDFTTAVVNQVKAVSQEYTKKVASQSSVKPSTFTASYSSSKSPKKMSFSFYSFASKVQQTFSDMIMKMLETMWQIQKQIEEKSKEAEKKKIEKRKFREKEGVQEDQLAEDIQTQVIEQQIIKTAIDIEVRS